jgi:ribosomal protein S18 acetylase RimI-like enzyme
MGFDLGGRLDHDGAARDTAGLEPRQRLLALCELRGLAIASATLGARGELLLGHVGILPRVMDPTITLRPPTPDEVALVAPLAAQLVRQHHAFDPQRFMLLEPLEPAYASFLARELEDANAVLVAAFHDAGVCGYVYARLEERDWNNLLDACGAIHDVFVAEAWRRHGIARGLVDDALSRLHAKGAPRVVLHTAHKNASAQRFFESLGFRRTMIEMTRER